MVLVCYHDHTTHRSTVITILAIEDAMVAGQRPHCMHGCGHRGHRGHYRIRPRLRSDDDVVNDACDYMPATSIMSSLFEQFSTVLGQTWSIATSCGDDVIANQYEIVDIDRLSWIQHQLVHRCSGILRWTASKPIEISIHPNRNAFL